MWYHLLFPPKFVKNLSDWLYLIISAPNQHHCVPLSTPLIFFCLFVLYLKQTREKIYKMSHSYQHLWFAFPVSVDTPSIYKKNSNKIKSSSRKLNNIGQIRIKHESSFCEHITSRLKRGSFVSLRLVSWPLVGRTSPIGSKFFSHSDIFSSDITVSGSQKGFPFVSHPVVVCFGGE